MLIIIPKIYHCTGDKEIRKEEIRGISIWKEAIELLLNIDEIDSLGLPSKGFLGWVGASPVGTVAMRGRKAVIKIAHVLEETQQDSVECAAQAAEKCNTEKDIVAHIKKESDKKNSPPGPASWGGTLVVTWPNTNSLAETKHFVYSPWAKWLFFCSNPGKNLDCTTHPVTHPEMEPETFSLAWRITLILNLYHVVL